MRCGTCCSVGSADRPDPEAPDRRLLVEIVLELNGGRTAVADFFTVAGGKIQRLAVYLGGALP